MTEVKGQGGRVALDDDAVTLVFDGWTSSREQKAASPRRVPLGEILVAEFREADGMTPGFLRLWLREMPPGYTPGEPQQDINTLKYKTDVAGMRGIAIDVNRRIGAPVAVQVADGSVVRTDLPEAMQRSELRLRTGKEVNRLRELLGPDEVVLELSAAAYERNNGIVALTDRRLVFFDQSGRGERMEEFPLATITHVAVERESRLGAELKLHAGPQKLHMDLWPWARGLAVAKAINDRAGGGAHHAGAGGHAAGPDAVPTPAADQTDVIEQIKRLGELRDAGMLTPEEFEATKADLLKRL